jgi:hypothetical protein
MRIFQASSLPPDYLLAIRSRDGEHKSFAERSRMFINDGYGSAHLLLPVLRGETTAFFANGNDHYGQSLWARENGLSASASEQTILLAQIEAHRTEVFYNLDPVRYGSSFVKRLPGCVRRSLCWRAAPSSGADFAAYDLVLGNFAGILKQWSDQGCNTKYFSPAWDMEIESIRELSARTIDVAFVGSYSSLHRRRNQILTSIAKMQPEWNIVYCLSTSRVTRIANTLLGALPILADFKQSTDLRRVLRPPAYGRALHSILRNAKIVLNAHGEIAGDERGNMRCFEAVGCGSLLLSDRGRYPEGFVAGLNYIDYASADEAKRNIRNLLENDDQRNAIVTRGKSLMCEVYNKSTQWTKFQKLAA